MGYVVKQGRSVIYGDEDGVRRYAAGETVEGAHRGQLDGCSAVEWLTARQAKAQEKPDEEPAGDADGGESDGRTDDRSASEDAGERGES